MLFVKDLTVPAVDSKVQLKLSVKATGANPFNQLRLVKKRKSPFKG
jgi:hypothetical protein